MRKVVTSWFSISRPIDGGRWRCVVVDGRISSDVCFVYLVWAADSSSIPSLVPLLVVARVLAVHVVPILVLVQHLQHVESIYRGPGKWSDGSSSYLCVVYTIQPQESGNELLASVATPPVTIPFPCHSSKPLSRLLSFVSDPILCHSPLPLSQPPSPVTAPFSFHSSLSLSQLPFPVTAPFPCHRVLSLSQLPSPVTPPWRSHLPLALLFHHKH